MLLDALLTSSCLLIKSLSSVLIWNFGFLSLFIVFENWSNRDFFLIDPISMFSSLIYKVFLCLPGATNVTGVSPN